MKKAIIAILLRVLNSSWLNATPCKYNFIGNIDNFSREDIESTLRQLPDITLREYLEIANRFKFCPISRTGITAIEPDGSYTQNVRFD